MLEAADQKNGKPGLVPLNHEAREAMLSRARFRATRCPSSPWVFSNRAGERIASVKRSFARAVALDQPRYRVSRSGFTLPTSDSEECNKPTSTS